MPATVYNRIKGDVSPLPNHILVVNLERGKKILSSGLILPDDDMTERGIRPRWAKVYKVGQNIDFVKPNEWVLIEHGRWTYGIVVETDNEELYLHRIDNDAILVVSEDKPNI